MIINKDKIFENYDEYLKSERWERLRVFKLKKAEFKCQMCGEMREKLEVHHNSYDNIYNEKESDLIVLCKSCHEWHHVNKEDKLAILIALKNKQLNDFAE